LKKILVADDSEFIRKVIKDVLSPEYAVVTANSGKKALEIYGREKPDMILLDIIMPGGEQEGIRVLEELIRMDGNAVVIMITAVGQNAIRIQCARLGAKSYIVKPFDENDLLQTVKEYMP